MNTNLFAAFISYLTAKSGVIFEEYEIGAILIYINSLTTTANGFNTVEKIDELLKGMKCANEGKGKIPAIKTYRELTNAGLKEAKNAVEHYMTPVIPDVDKAT